MKTRSLTWGALLALLLALSPPPAHASLLPMFKECIAGVSPATLCGVDSTAQGAAVKALQLYCDIVLAPNPGPFGGTCETITWTPGPFGSGTGVMWVRELGIAHHTEIAGTYLAFSGPIDTCTIATATSGPCGAKVAQLKAIVKAPDDPTRVFHNTLTCITSASCALRCNMDNCDWLSELVPLFNDRYLQGFGDWPVAAAACAARGTGRVSDLRCAEQQARLHIGQDLIPSLIQAGCGSESDWASVYSAIESCTAQNIGGRSGAVAANGTYAYRTIARQTCIVARLLAGKDVSINPSTKGQVCTP